VCWRYAQSAPPPPKPLVVLVHGWCSDPSTFGNFANLLASDAGLDVGEPFDYSQFTKVPVIGGLGLSIQELASLLGGHVLNQLKLHPEATQVDIVAHSMGGLITRAWMVGDTSVPVPYNGEIRKLVLIGTPEYGASLARLSLLGYLISFLPGNFFSCSFTQAEQMQLGSPFLMDLDQQWNSFEATSTSAIRNEDMLFIAGTRDSTPPPIGYECGSGPGCDDGVVDISSAVLNNATNVRYVPYKHTDAIKLPTGGPLIQAPPTTQHKSYLLTKSFLSSGIALDQCCGATTADYLPPHLRGVPGSDLGLLILRVRDANNKPVKSLLAPSFTFSPKLVPAAQLWWNSASGVATFLGTHEGSYTITARLRSVTGSTQVVVTTAEPNIPAPLILK